MDSLKRGLMIGLGIFIVFMAAVGIGDVVIIASASHCDAHYAGDRL